jgi:hypothetical protein
VSALRLDPMTRGRIQAACNVVNEEIAEQRRVVFYGYAAIAAIGLALLGAHPDWWRYILAGAVLANAILTGTARNRIRKSYKSLVIGRIVKALDRGLTYNPKSSFRYADLKAMDLFPNKYNGFSSEDELSGRKENVSYSVHEVRLKATGGSNVKIFEGMMIRLDFNKNFRGHTIVIPDSEARTLGPVFGELLESSSRRNKRLVKLENRDFERVFAVYSTDDQEARYLLTPKLMELALQANALHMTQIRLVFLGNSLFVAIPMKGDRFEATIHSVVTPESALSDFLGVVDLAEQLIDTFQLETRIWSRA